MNPYESPKEEGNIQKLKFEDKFYLIATVIMIVTPIISYKMELVTLLECILVPFCSITANTAAWLSGK